MGRIRRVSRKVVVPFADDPAKAPRAIADYRRRLAIPKDDFEDLDDEQREYARVVAGSEQASIVAYLWDATDSAITNGEDFADFKARVGDSMNDQWGGAAPSRLETTFLTNLTTTYNAGRRNVFTAPAVKEARPYWRFEWVDDDRLCEICEACAGVILPADDPWWNSHVGPLHFRCRCSFTAVSREEAGDDISASAPGGDSDPDDGFGESQGPDGTDWQPRLRDFPEDIRDVLREALAG